MSGSWQADATLAETEESGDIRESLDGERCFDPLAHPEQKKIEPRFRGPSVSVEH